MDVLVTYSLTDDDTLHIRYDAKADQDTIMNFTNHSYFNLAGQESGSVKDQLLQIFAQAYTPVVDPKSIPTGEIAPVASNSDGFHRGEADRTGYRCRFEQLKFTGGYDHNYVLSDHAGEQKVMARAYSKKSGIAMEASTDCCGVQFYAGNFIGEQTGKGGAAYHDRSGFCLESQFYPDAINQKNFPSPVVKAGEEYRSETSYRFYTR